MSFEMMIYTIALAFILIIIYLRCEKSNVPYPYSLPLIGNAHLFLWAKRVATGKATELLRKFPDIIEITLSFTRGYYIDKPEYLQIILNDPKLINKAEPYEELRDLTGDSVFTIDTPFWKTIRRTIQSRFSQRTLNGFVDTIVDRAEEFVDNLRKYTDGQTHDLTLPIHVCSIKSICATQFGLKLDEETIETIHEVVEKMTLLSYKLITNIFLQIDWIFKLTKYYQMKIDCVKSVEKVRDKLFKQKLIERAIEQKHPETLLDLLMGLMDEKKLNREQIDAEFNIILIAGYDTSAKTLTFLFVTLGLHQDVQDKIHEEIMEVLGDKRVDFNDLPKMKYTECVIKETLRLFPVAHSIARYLPYDMTLGQHKLAGNSTLYLGIFSVQRNPLYWKDPLKFDPDRFLAENMKDRHPYSFLAFSAGPRNCLGGTYAMMSLKCMVINIVKNYRIRTIYDNVNDINLSESVFLSLEEGTKTILELRK